MSLRGLSSVVVLLVTGMPAIASDAPETIAPMVAPEYVHAAPLSLITLHDRMKVQVPYVGPASIPTVVSPGMPAGPLIAGNLLGGLVVAGIEHQRLKEARADMQPAYQILKGGRCVVDASTRFLDALEPVARKDQSPATVRHTLKDKQTVDDFVSAKDERHIVMASYALTAELGYLLTTVHAVYAPASEDKKNSDISWTGQITVASPAPPVAAKTAEDIARLEKIQHARWSASDGPALVEAANKGDTRARREVVTRYKQHQDILKQARAPEWSQYHLSSENAQAWAAQDCNLLREAIDKNAALAAQLLTRLYAGDLPAQAKPGFWKLPPVQEQVRDGLIIRNTGRQNWIAWPDGLPAPGRYLSSAWMEDEEGDVVALPSAVAPAPAPATSTPEQG